jgi:diguanylate cyclase (GGDEF)-like protein
MGMALREGSTRTRAGDRKLRRSLPRLIVTRPEDGIDAILLGRVLMIVAIALVAATVPMLDPGTDSWVKVTEVCAPLAGLLAASFAVPWSRVGDRVPLVFPVMICIALMILSGKDASVYSPLTGLLSLSFAYLGLTQPPRTSIAMVPIAAVTFVLVNGQLSSPVMIRLLIACSIWVMLGELLSRFTRRQQALSTALRIAAHTDALTGVANRRDLELHLAVASPGDLIVLCDLDRFKQLNDTRGHHVGDQVLADFGSMLRVTLRGNDYCARFGGEEFVLALPATSVAEGEALLARLRAHWAVLHPDVTFSAGLAVIAADRSHADTLAAADAALYAAKAAGRNCNAMESEIAPPVAVDGGAQA